MWDLTIHLSSVSNVLAGTPPGVLTVVDIVRFGLLRIVVGLTILKRVC